MCVPLLRSLCSSCVPVVFRFYGPCVPVVFQLCSTSTVLVFQLCSTSTVLVFQLCSSCVPVVPLVFQLCSSCGPCVPVVFQLCSSCGPCVPVVFQLWSLCSSCVPVIWMARCGNNFDLDFYQALCHLRLPTVLPPKSWECLSYELPPSYTIVENRVDVFYMNAILAQGRFCRSFLPCLLCRASCRCRRSRWIC